MNEQTMLGLYHFANQWHGGQSTRLYRLLCRVTARWAPARSDEYLRALARPDNAEARETYVGLVTNHTRARDDGGYVDCVCCGHCLIVDHIGAESGVTMCDECVGADCDPDAPCMCEDEDDGDECEEVCDE
jgi:hypothetical protein